MSVERFGIMPDGSPVDRVRLGGFGLTANIITYGAVLQDLRLDGHAPALVLGFDDLPSYLDHSPYFGANAGRNANRIRDGHLVIDGQTFQLEKNFLGKHNLHGGTVGCGSRLWTLQDVTASTAKLSVQLGDSEMGFPGNLDLNVTFSLLEGGTFDVRYTATTDKPTLCNIAHHSYFALDDAPSALAHEFQVDAETYNEADDELIMTGATPNVAGTELDFRALRRIGKRPGGKNYDLNFVVSDRKLPLRKVAGLRSPLSGISMQIKTTEPGLQFYDGDYLDVPVPGHGGRPINRNAGIAIEPQMWPNSTHHPHFPQAILRPGETYQQHSQFVFSKDTT